MGKYRVLRNCTLKDGRAYIAENIIDIDDSIANHHLEKVSEDTVKKVSAPEDDAKALSQMVNAAKPIKTAAEVLGNKPGRPKVK